MGVGRRAKGNLQYIPGTPKCARRSGTGAQLQGASPPPWIGASLFFRKAGGDLCPYPLRRFTQGQGGLVPLPITSLHFDEQMKLLTRMCVQQRK